jgi:hypothetical protein
MGVSWNRGSKQCDLVGVGRNDFPVCARGEIETVDAKTPGRNVVCYVFYLVSLCRRTLGRYRSITPNCLSAMAYDLLELSL